MLRVERVTVACAACGKGVERYPAQVAASKTGRFFCNAECRNEVGAKPRTVLPSPCEWCGAPTVSYGKDRGRFCSKGHYDAWQRRNRITRTCEWCSRDFELKPSQAKHLTGRWCGRACESESRIKRPLERRHNGKPAIVDKQGYVRIFEPDHPRAMNGGWVFEHRYITEQQFGRHLRQDEHVHHINGQKDDNRPENLAVLSHSEHSTITVRERAETLKAMQNELEEYRKRYGLLT